MVNERSEFTKSGGGSLLAAGTKETPSANPACLRLRYGTARIYCLPRKRGRRNAVAYSSLESVGPIALISPSTFLRMVMSLIL